MNNLYTIAEDLSIIKYIIKYDGVDHVGGKILWENMEERFQSGKKFD